jgi:predicted secreted protein
MTQNAVKKATALLAASLALVSPALAGDRAMIEIIGYSPDYRYFAFEEFGLQDGSGFPYANIYVLDLPSDSWVKGTPVRTLIKDDSLSSTEAEARDKARAEAQSKLDELEIGESAEWIAMNGDGEPGDGTSLKFGSPGYFYNDPQGSYELTLETYTAEAGEDYCSGLVDEILGFALTLDDNGTERELHRDTGKLPASRGCPMAYRIHGVVARPATDAVHAGVAIISVFPYGFEGPDRRFIAIPLGN